MKTYLITLTAAASLLAGCNPSVESASQDFNSLPPDVQKAVRAQAPNAEIASVSQTTENGVQAYKVEFREPETNPELLVTADGKVLNSPGTDKTEGLAGTLNKALTPTGAVGTQFSALPPAVQKTIQAHGAATEITDVARGEDNGRVIYTVEFRDSQKNPTIKVAEDGTLVQGLQK